MEKNRFQPDIILKTESNNICSEYSQINKPHNQKDQQIMEFTILRVIAVYLIFVSHFFLTVRFLVLEQEPFCLVHRLGPVYGCFLPCQAIWQGELSKLENITGGG